MDVGRNHDRHERVLQRVALEDVGEGGADDDAEAVLHQRPRRVLARTAATEVVSRHQDLRSLGGGLVQREIRVGRAVREVAPVEKQIFAEAFHRRGLEKPRGNDLVGIDVLDGENHGLAFHSVEFHERLLTSVTTPVTALAAAVKGLAKNVLPPLPWRPSKLRLLVETLYSPASTSSPSMPRPLD